MLNKVVLMGRLTKDPEMRYTGNNTPVCNFTLAVNRSFKGKNGEKEADFINIVVWKHTAEFVNKYFSKGLQVVVCGRLQVRKWQDKQGNNRYATEVVANETYFADNKKKNGENQQEDTSFKEILYNDDDLPF